MFQLLDSSFKDGNILFKELTPSHPLGRHIFAIVALISADTLRANRLGTVAPLFVISYAEKADYHNSVGHVPFCVYGTVDMRRL